LKFCASIPAATEIKVICKILEERRFGKNMADNRKSMLLDQVRKEI